MADILDAVRDALRITSTVYDDELEGLIATARVLMVESGVAEHLALSDDPAIRTAIVAYCKANFGMDNPDHERYTRAFNSLCHHLHMTADYGA